LTIQYIQEKSHDINLNISLPKQLELKKIYYPAPVKTENFTLAPTAPGPVFIHNSDFGSFPGCGKNADTPASSRCNRCGCIGPRGWLGRLFILPDTPCAREL